MSNHITVLITGSDELHMGLDSGYEQFAGKYFEKVCDDINVKKIINSVKYQTDSTYNHTDGHCGTCWVAEIIDDESVYGVTYYHFRNFEPLVELYKGKGYKFVGK